MLEFSLHDRRGGTRMPVKVNLESGKKMGETVTPPKWVKIDFSTLNLDVDFPQPATTKPHTS